MMSDVQPLVSVIVPTYNGGKRIARTLESLIAQDYRNLEIIVVDDVSTDNTVSAALETLEKSGRVFRIIQRTVNGRQSASRNTGLREARGEYVIFFDHDDLADKEFVSLLCAEAEAENADLVFCGIKEYNEDSSQYIYKPVTLKRKFSSPKDYLTAWSRQKADFCYVWCFIFRKNFLERNKLCFPEKCYLGEDIEFVMKALALSEATSFVPDALYTYTRHSGQQSTAEYTLRHSSEIFKQSVVSRYRIARCIIRNTSDMYVRNYTLSYMVAHELVKKFTLAAQEEEKEYFFRMLKILRHRKIRQIMFLTARFMLVEPELFFKCLMLLYAPNIYYVLRRKK